MITANFTADDRVAISILRTSRMELPTGTAGLLRRIESTVDVDSAVDILRNPDLLSLAMHTVRFLEKANLDGQSHGLQTACLRAAATLDALSMEIFRDGSAL